MAVKITGGDRLGKYLLQLGTRLGTGGVVKVGFLEGATYPGDDKSKGLPVATVAFWNEFGTVRTPPRPFFRNMIAEQSPTWGRKMGAAAKAAGYDSKKALALMGTNIKDQLVKAIVDWPADNAPRTVARKGFNKGLIDTGVMQRAPDYVVEADGAETK